MNNTVPRAGARVSQGARAGRELPQAALLIHVFPDLVLVLLR